MSLKLMYITNDSIIAKIAEDSGVDWIFIDLEVNGKLERQGHLDTVISKHSISDIYKIKRILSKSKLLVRVNPIFAGSKDEINSVIDAGADIIMLPYFKTNTEVKTFLKLINNRVETCLLLETPSAVNIIDDILREDKVDYIHIGLNDLHLGYKKDFMFELLVDGTVSKLTAKMRLNNIMFGFGGIAQLGQGDLPANYVIAEHYRLGSSMAILSRSFFNHKKISDYDKAVQVFRKGISNIREFELSLLSQKEDYFLKNYSILKKSIEDIVKNIRKNKKV